MDHSGSRGLRPGVGLYQVDNEESGSNLNRSDAAVYIFKDPSVGSVAMLVWKRVGERDCKQGTPWPHLSESSDGRVIY